MTDVIEQQTVGGKAYCSAIVDTGNRRTAGWSIDTAQDAKLVVNVLDIGRQAACTMRGSIVDADHGIPAQLLGIHRNSLPQQQTT